MATYSALANALAAGDIWVPTSRLHRSLDTLLAPAGVQRQAAFTLGDPHAWLDERAEKLDQSLSKVASSLNSGDGALFVGDRLRFPKDTRDDSEDDAGQKFARTCYRCLLYTSPSPRD